MKLFEYRVDDDFGEEYYIHIFKSKKYIGLAIELHYHAYGGSFCFEFLLGLGQLASVLICLHRWSLMVRLFLRRSDA